MRSLTVLAVVVFMSAGSAQEMPKNLRGLLSVSRVWQISGGEIVDSKPTIPKAPGGKGTIAFGPDGRRYVIGAASHEVDPFYLAEGESVLEAAVGFSFIIIYNSMTFRQFLEAKEKTGDTQRHKAQVEIAEALRGVFKKYAVTTCREAWERITSKKGNEQVQKLINNNTISLSAFHALN